MTKKIELVSLELTNFKGATHFKLDAKGSDVDVFGKNGAGKTTLYDAFTWCLFHKDSKDKTDFEFEPQGEEVEELASVSVSLTLSVNGQNRNFTKELNKRKNVKLGGIVKEPAYYVDDLKLKTKKAYDEKVAELIDKDKFKYLTNGSYFMENLKASERREILFEYFGSKSDEEIINENKELAPLLKYLAESSLDEENQKLQQQKQSLEKTIKEIPIQIKGIRKTLPEIQDINIELLNKDKSELIIKIDQAQKDLLALENGSAVTDKKNLIKEKQSALRILEGDYTSNQKKKTSELEEKRSDLRLEYKNTDYKLTDVTKSQMATALEIEKSKEYLKHLETELSNYGKQLDGIEESKFSYPEFVAETFDEHAFACPTCKRAWETEDQEKLKEEFNERHEQNVMSYSLAKEKALRTFNENNDAEFDRINQLGKEASQDIETTNLKLKEQEHELDNNKKVVESIQKELEVVKKQGDEVTAQIKAIETNLVPFVESDDYINVQTEIAEIEKEIADLSVSSKGQVDAKNLHISDLNSEVQMINEKLAIVSDHNRHQAVINQLIEDEKTMSAEKGEIEAELLLFENFFIKKVGLLEENINQHFKFIEFKLFDYYDNGNLDESLCEPVLNDVKYRDMSNGEQIKARIDICDTLMRAEDIYVPLFLDNAEGLTESFETETQVIALNASKQDESLRIEIQNIKTEVAA